MINVFQDEQNNHTFITINNNKSVLRKSICEYMCLHEMKYYAFSLYNLIKQILPQWESSLTNTF